jgi:hypothetical protein
MFRPLERARTCVAAITVIASVGLQAAAVRAAGPDDTYELYSWTIDNSIWNFSVLSHTSRDRHVLEVFESTAFLGGIDDLKRWMRIIPKKGTTVLWIDHPPLSGNAKDTRSQWIQYPPSAMIDDVRQHAERNRITLEIVPQSESSAKPSHK